jgi:hypothetical protein
MTFTLHNITDWKWAVYSGAVQYNGSPIHLHRLECDLRRHLKVASERLPYIDLTVAQSHQFSRVMENAQPPKTFLKLYLM